VRTRRQSARDKELREQRVEFRLWAKWRRQRVEALLNGPYSEAVQSLLIFSKTMPTPSALLDFIARGPWSDADADTRAEVLSLLDAVITKRRERMGFVPFDDALPGQPDNLFLLLRELLAPPPGAKPGLSNETLSIRNTENVE
jgi:hypothetical protein